MTIANNVGASELLRWNATQNRFTSVWSGSPYLQLEPISIQQPGGQLYLLAGADVVTSNDGKLLQISRIAAQSDFVYRRVMHSCLLQRQQLSFGSFGIWLS